MPINSQTMSRHNGLPYPYGTIPGAQPINPYGGIQNAQNSYLRAPVTESHLPRVYGIRGAQEYPIAFNSEIALFDAEEDVFYLKEADANGYTRLTKYEYKESVIEDPNTPKYVTMEDFEKFKKEVLDGQQRIQKTIKSNNRSNYSKPVSANASNQYARSNDESSAISEQSNGYAAADGSK